jgi:hypothetical protein
MKENDKPRLHVFLRLNTFVFYNHTFTTVDEMKETWVTRFKLVAKQGLNEELSFIDEEY